MRETSGNFLNHMIGNLIFPLEEQDHVGNGKDFWCLDWWAIEVGKYFFEGDVGYLRFPIARRLIDNDNFNKYDIEKAALSKQKAMDEMKVLSSSIDRLIVIETCRGFDTVLSMKARDWKEVFVVIDSKYPSVIQKTTEYLSNLYSSKPVQVVDNDIGLGITDVVAKMKTIGFGGAK